MLMLQALDRPVERLSFTILDIGIPSKEQYRQLNKVFDGTNSCTVYRHLLAANAHPTVPHCRDIISTPRRCASTSAYPHNGRLPCPVPHPACVHDPRLD
ncbi:hypothetical protein B0H14DRAFT_3142132 [Mycena olivaceomarginata]|nr:hypothetical protein B0H14DRAFT_3142132 [Mycena olivaceomarginata]